MLAAGSVNFHAVAGGSGPALLPIGGWPQTGYTWRAIMPHLLSEGFSVIAVDPRGTGTSDIVASDDSGSYYDITTVSDELVAMMNALGHERFCVAGHEIGMGIGFRSEEHTSELQYLMRISYAVFCLKKKQLQVSHLDYSIKLNSYR